MRIIKSQRQNRWLLLGSFTKMLLGSFTKMLLGNFTTRVPIAAFCAHLLMPCY